MLGSRVVEGDGAKEEEWRVPSARTAPNSVGLCVGVSKSVAN